MRKKIEIEVQGINLLRQLSAREIRNVIPQLTPHLGKKIILASGEWAAGFKIEFTPFNDGKVDDNWVSRTVYLSAPNSLLWLNVKVCISSENRAHYFEGGYAVASVENQLLATVGEIEVNLQEYKLNLPPLTVKEEQEKIDSYKNAKAVMEKARKTISVGEEFLRYS